jgi:hypothetical protein
VTRPRTAADCGNGQWFQCTLAYVGDTPIAVNCLCTPPEQGCDSCANQGFFGSPAFSCGDHTKLCSCPAYTGILR